MIVIEAPAKVNLILQMLRRDDDGYHDLRTLFQSLRLHDRLEVGLRDAPGIGLEVVGADVGPAEQNLACRAARAFLDAAGEPASGGGVRIRLEKRIPAGGGLGGGSSDAAATLRALDRLTPGRVQPGEMMEIAARLGSDVPFFLGGHPLARGEGRGERLTPLPPLPPRPVVLVLPPFGVATGEAYRWLDEDRGDDAGRNPPPPLPPAAREVLEGGTRNWEELAAVAFNDFEDPVFRRHPPLRGIRDTLLAHGAAPALLAGSGSSVFGVFAAADVARAAADAVRREWPECRVVRTRSHGPPSR